MIAHYLIILTILTAGAVASAKAGKLTTIASITGWLVGLLVFMGAGFAGVIMLAAFFILGTTATSFKISVKQKIGFAEKNKGKRTAGQVVANAGVAALLGLLAWLLPSQSPVLTFMLAASLASATADTLSSELGNVYGRNFYNILTLKKDTRGLDGVISFEGTLAGIAGSAVIAFIYAWPYEINAQNIFIIIIAGTAGNISDSVLGASFERKGLLNNDAVNFLNTAIGALTALLLYEVTVS